MIFPDMTRFCALDSKDTGALTARAPYRYHSLHHTRVHTNFSLFMPLYDYLYGTVDADSDTLYEQTVKGEQHKPAPGLLQAQYLLMPALSAGTL
jgi:sterol desaturase/sphingolipid hydroxylase (fatty acid hydroxylase superfamily)